MSLTPSPSSLAAVDGQALPRRVVAVCAITIAAVLSVLDGSMLNVALPHLAAELGLTPSMSVWIINAYQLTIVASLLPLALLGERIGYARLFRIGIGLFTVSALACALSQDIETLVVARIAQGVGSGCVMSCSAGLLRATYPARLFPTGLAINTMAVTFAAASGPALSSAILSVVHWRWLFVVSVPTGAIAWACAWFLMATPGQRRTVAGWSVALNTAAMLLTVIGLDLLGRQFWMGAATLIASVAVWIAWIRHDASKETPLLPLDLFRIHRFRYAVLTSVLMFAAQATSLVALPFYLHDQLGLSLAQTALLLTAWPISATATTAVSARLLKRFGPARLCMASALLMPAGLSWVLLTPVGAGFPLLYPGMLLGGVAVGLFQTPNTHDMLASTPRVRSGAAGGMQAIARVGGQTLGATLVGFGLGMSEHTGATAALLGGGLVAVAALVVNARRLRVTSDTSDH